MVKKLSLLISVGSLALFAAWFVVSGFYKSTKPDTVAATVLKPTKPLQAKFLRGHWNLVFFGYMQCPKICPATLALVREAWNMFPTQQQPARFIFANITPCDLGELQEFLRNYNVDFIGLTNDNPEMQYLYKELGIFANEQGAVIEHTAALMLIDPQSRLRAIFTPPFTAGQLFSDLKVLTRT